MSQNHLREANANLATSTNETQKAYLRIYKYQKYPKNNSCIVRGFEMLSNSDNLRAVVAEFNTYKYSQSSQLL
jgi:hypothetical protein